MIVIIKTQTLLLTIKNTYLTVDLNDTMSKTIFKNNFQ